MLTIVFLIVGNLRCQPRIFRGHRILTINQDLGVREGFGLLFVEAEFVVTRVRR